MAVTVSTVSTLVRHVLQDNAVTQNPGDIYTYTTLAVFTLSEPLASAITTVYKNGVALTAGQYSFDSTSKKVTITASLLVGDTIEIQYTYFPNYSDAELEAYVRSAVIHLSVNNYYTFELDTTGDTFYPEPTAREANLIAFVASILVKPENQTIRLPDITITVPPSMPTRDIISKAVKIFKHNTTGVFDIAGFGNAFYRDYQNYQNQPYY